MDLMEKLYQYFDEESSKMDKRLTQINSDTLQACEEILAKPERYNARILAHAEDTKNQIKKATH